MTSRGLQPTSPCWTRRAGSSARCGSEPATEYRSYGHIVVDEVQDLSPMELRMVGRRSLSGSMTLVGDIAQATGYWAPNSWDDLMAHLPARRGWRLASLSVSYRACRSDGAGGACPRRGPAWGQAA